MSKFYYSFHSFEKNILQKLALIILVGISVSFSTLNAQSYEILFDTHNASGWFGGDNRPGFGPRHVGVSQSVLIDSAITLNSFAFDFTSRFDYAENPDGFGHEVTLTLNIRDDSGVIIQTEQVVVPASYEGGWITWSNINMNVAANTTLIFSAYLVGAYDLNQYTTGNKSDANAGYLEGERYVKVGISDADMDLWAGWNVHPWDSNFWLQGTLQIIPVELTLFKADVVESSVVLEWTTATETNNRGFEVQRNIKGNWETLDFIHGKGNSVEITQYAYQDDFNKVNYSGDIDYRLKQIDFDGTFIYSDVVVVEVDFSPTEYSLSQNYPNPFNPSTKIKYAIRERSFVELKIYDILGSEVNVIVNKEQSAGSYEVEFSATSLPSGLYFYKLQAGDFVETKKMVLLK
jgi:hypothetical protein